jgi:hypothetical protein
MLAAPHPWQASHSGNIIDSDGGAAFRQQQAAASSSNNPQFWNFEFAFAYCMQRHTTCQYRYTL